MFTILNSFSEAITRVLDKLGSYIYIYCIIVINSGNSDFIYVGNLRDDPDS